MGIISVAALLRIYDLILLIALYEFNVCVLQHKNFCVLVSGREANLLLLYFLLSFSKMKLEDDLMGPVNEKKIEKE